MFRKAEDKSRLWLGLSVLCLGVFFVVRELIKDTKYSDTYDAFLTFFLSLIIEAVPFIFIGVAVSVVVGTFINIDFFLKKLPKNIFVSHFLLSTLGIFMPVCECGNVPVVRRLLLNNFKVSHSIVFLLAAPIVNPITFFSTFVAFGNSWDVALTRMVLGLLIANIIAYIISLLNHKESEILNPKFYEEVCDHDHEHSHSHSKLDEALDIFQKEFVSLFKLMIIGAFIAAFSQTIVPRDVITVLNTNAVTATIAMIVLAFAVSICANIDAFLAYSYVGTFPIGSLMAFMVFGPMIDIKMLTMLSSTFRTKLLAQITVLVTLLSLISGLIVNFIL